MTIGRVGAEAGLRETLVPPEVVFFVATVVGREDELELAGAAPPLIDDPTSSPPPPPALASLLDLVLLDAFDRTCPVVGLEVVLVAGAFRVTSLLS